MARSATRVAFVAAGAFGKPASYVSLAESWKRFLDRELQHNTTEPAFLTEVFAEIEPALAFLSGQTGGTRTLALLSEQLGHQAPEIARKNPNIQVVVFTGAQPQPGEVLTVRKKWIGGADIKKFVD